MSNAPIVISLTDLRDRGIRLTVEEAIAIVFQLGHRLSWQMAPPPPSAILLYSDGRVDVRWPHEADRPTAAAFADLLHELLPEAGVVPGGLRVLVARAAGGTPLPPIATGPEFAAALYRFLGAERLEAIPATVARVVHRTTAAPPPVVARRAAGERRASGPSVSELRRQLQEADLARYSLLARLEDAGGHRSRRRAPVLRIEGLAAAATAPRDPRDATSRRVDAFRYAVSGLLGPLRSRLRTASIAGAAAVLVALLLGIAADGPMPQLPPRPQPPAPQLAQTLPELPVPIELLASEPAPAVNARPDDSESPQLTSVRQVTGEAPARKPGKRRQQENKFLRFVKSLFKA